MSSIFLKPSDPLLVKIAEELPKSQIPSQKTKKIIEKMLKMAFGEQKDKDKPVMVGLAAPQIGISKRIILVDIAANGKGKIGDLKIFINPEIIWQSKKMVAWYEGCFSTSRVCGIVSRPASIKVKAYTADGEITVEKHKDYVARIFQHEIDHLNGKVFVDFIKDPDKLHWVRESEFPLYRNKEAWRNWPKKCSFEKWQRIKNEC